MDKEIKPVSQLSIIGHAYARVFTYVAGDVHNEFTAPGGAALLDRLLGGLEPDLAGYRREYAELSYYEDKKAKTSRWAISRHMGYSGGETAYASGDGKKLLVWDEGFGGIKLPRAKKLTLWASKKALPERGLFGKIAGQTTLFLDADVLRSAGAMISRQISWERTVSETLWQLQNNPALSYLLAAPRIIISFAEDGALDIKTTKDELRAFLHLAHGGGEGTSRRKPGGCVDDAFLLMTAYLAEHFPKGDLSKLLHRAQTLMDGGYTPDGLKNSAYPEQESFDRFGSWFIVPVKSGEAVAESWCATVSPYEKRLFDIAFDHVTRGAGEIAGLPQLCFGKLTTVDRWEVEAFQNVKNQIESYAANEDVKPLSIAVFGSPGSGKSFGVTQIAENVLPGKVEKLEFNVSQFNDFADLGAAFQKVRDLILKGKLPLVFFDEFDSDRDSHPLGWVKSFLMPMQDGKFKDSSGEHPVGKCILVFAGGTAHSFERFCEPMTGEGEKAREFKNAKGPDFVSRLKGTINVLGPNPKDENDNNFILRRALLLRSLCERKFKLKADSHLPVSRDIIRAMLLVPEYKHGARSMEAILDMSRLEGAAWEPATLPFYSQLALHVDAEAFTSLVLRDVILNSYNEKLAQAIHADFLAEMTAAKKPKQPSAVPWEELAEHYRQSNRSVARGYGEDLKAVGFDYDAGETPFKSVEEFGADTLLELAQLQHIRYVNEKKASGWVLGNERDDVKKTNPTLLPWENLPEDERKKDFDIAKKIIPQLKSVGLRVYKII